MRLNTPLPVLLALMGIFVLPTGVRGQITLNVPSTTYPTIQSAINAAVTGDTVLVAPGTYVENLNWPAVDVHLLGAGPGLSIIDGNQTGSCVKMLQGATPASILEGFTLTNGSGTLTFVNTTMSPTGGGLHIQTGTVATNPTIRKCHVVGNTAFQAGGVHLRYAGAIFEDCRFSANSFTGGQTATTSTLLAEAGGLLTLRRCVFEANTGLGDCVSLKYGNPLVVESCRFKGNTCTSVLNGSGLTSVRVSGSIFEDNIVDNYVLWLTHAPNLTDTTSTFVFESNAIIDNIVSFSGVAAYITLIGLSSNNHCDVTGATIAGNTLQASQGGCLVYSGSVAIRDAVIHGNLAPSGLVMPAFYNRAPNWIQPFICVDSIIEGATGYGPSVLDIDPQFLDPSTGDYRSAPGSPLIDAGSATPAYTPPPLDAQGLPRIRGASIDWGAYEAQSLAHHPASAGRVGENSGGPFDVMKVNGSSGDTLRTVRVPVGTAAIMEMLQPPQLSQPCQFSIFGILGEANFDTVTSVPLGIGDMMFAPAPLVPFFQPLVFTMASTVGPINGVLPLFPATPTPWNSGLGPAIPFPLTLTLQGVLEEAPGIYVPTNAVIYVVE